jgi:hypothetical protein
VLRRTGACMHCARWCRCKRRAAGMRPLLTAPHAQRCASAAVQAACLQACSMCPAGQATPVGTHQALPAAAQHGLQIPTAAAGRATPAPQRRRRQRWTPRRWRLSAPCTARTRGPARCHKHVCGAKSMLALSSTALVGVPRNVAVPANVMCACPQRWAGAQRDAGRHQGHARRLQLHRRQP